MAGEDAGLLIGTLAVGRESGRSGVFHGAASGELRARSRTQVTLEGGLKSTPRIAFVDLPCRPTAAATLLVDNAVSGGAATPTPR